MVNGVVQETTTAPAGVAVGKVAGSVLSTRDDTLVRINAALTGESLSLELANSVDPVVHIPTAGELDFDPTVLGPPAFGDLELSHDLDA